MGGFLCLVPKWDRGSANHDMAQGGVGDYQLLKSFLRVALSDVRPQEWVAPQQGLFKTTMGLLTAQTSGTSLRAVNTLRELQPPFMVLSPCPSVKIGQQLQALVLSARDR